MDPRNPRFSPGLAVGEFIEGTQARAQNPYPGAHILAAGLGEAPYLRQATFTIWESQLAMDDYARSGAHLEAIRSAYQGAFFSESMFTRFIPINPLGTWRGKKYA